MADNKVKVSNNQAHYWSEQARGYSQQAGSYATQAGTSATLAGNYYTSTQAAATQAITTIGNATTDALGSISTATTNGVGSVNAKATESLSIITATTTASTTTINALKTEALSVISATTSASTTAIQSVAASATTAATGSINDAKTSALNTISGAKTEAVSTISTLTTQAVNAINSTKTAYIAEMTTLKNQTTQAKNEALIWAEGSDADVQALGGTHSAKEWCLYNSTVNQNDVRALEGGLNQGEVFTQGDSDSIDSRLSEIKSIAHSTFDLSKFTVVGSPNITDDGIASGFSTSNYLTKNIAISGAWKINAVLNLSDVSTAFSPLFHYSAYNRILINSNGSITLFVASDNVNFANLTFFSENTVVANTNYFLEISYNGANTYTAKLKNLDNNTTIMDTKTSTNTLLSSSVTWKIGGDGINNYVRGSIDLKQFSITVDGVPVFSGNRTGVDTIKADDYTVVGTPTISADGVFNSTTTSYNTDYIYKSINLGSYTNSFKICGKSQYKVGTTQTAFYIEGTLKPRLIFSPNNTSGIQLYDDGNGEIFKITPTELYDGCFIEYQITYTPASVIYKFIVDNNVIENIVVMTNGTTIQSTVGKVMFASNTGANPILGLTDLNYCKIYVDGNLVYQPCLKIPYTESKTGSKMVNAVYRDRVNDMAEQFGYANYYTLSDTDFTLPQVELYGLIGQRTLRDNYRNGINYWELYSNRDLEQGGSCTSGVEVTFARPFADTNYVLSVPYSAKSATAFTPTQTGDWIAKGKGLL